VDRSYFMFRSLLGTSNNAGFRRVIGFFERHCAASAAAFCPGNAPFPPLRADSTLMRGAWLAQAKMYLVGPAPYGALSGGRPWAMPPITVTPPRF